MPDNVDLKVSLICVESYEDGTPSSQTWSRSQHLLVCQTLDKILLMLTLSNAVRQLYAATFRLSSNVGFC